MPILPLLFMTRSSGAAEIIAFAINSFRLEVLKSP